MKQLIIGGYWASLSDTTTAYNTVSGGYTWSNVANTRIQIVSTPGILSNFAIELSEAPGGGGSYTLTILNVTQGTSLGVTIIDPDLTGINTGTLVVAAGDKIEIQSTYDAPTNTPKAWWSVLFEGDNAKESLILGVGLCASAATRYEPIAHGSNTNAALESFTYQIIPTSGTIKNLYVDLSASPGTAPDAYRFTLRVNGANSDDGVGNPLQVTIVADDTAGNDAIHSIPVSAGDYVDLMIEPLETPSSSPIVGWGMTFLADTDGESIILGQSLDKPTLAQTEYNHIITTDYSRAWTTTEGQRYTGGQSGITLKKFYVMLSEPSIDSYVLNVRATSAGGNTGITITITAGNTTGNDTINTYSIGNYDDLDISCLAAGTAVMVYWGLVCYIAAEAPLGNKSANMGSKMVAAGLI